MASTDLFSVLANPVRRRILELLLKQPSTANALANQFAQHRPAVSEHLQVLRKARLVRSERHGREHHYHIEPEQLMSMRDWLAPFEQYWRQRMKALEEILNEEYEK